MRTWRSAMRLHHSAKVLAVLTTGVLLSACGAGGGSSTSSSSAPSKKLQVVTTTTQLADFAKVVGGDRVQVYSIAKPNVDPHDYEPTAADITAAAHADVIIKNGLGLEKWFDSAIGSEAANASKVDASDGVQVRRSADGKEQDPHIWTSVVNARIMVQNISEGLQQADPADKDSFVLAERAYDAQLDTLERDINAAISPLPDKRLVTDHDALGYYCEEFGLQFVDSVLPSFDTQAEPSASDLAAVVDKVRSLHVKAIFTEKSLPTKTADTVGREAGVKVVSGASAIYADSLGPADSDAGTYLEMMRRNTEVIVDNLR